MASRARTGSTISDMEAQQPNGKRELRLVRKVEEVKNRPIDFSLEVNESSTDSHGIAQGETTLVTDNEDDDYPRTRYRDAERRFSIQRGTTAISVSASMDRLTESDRQEEMDPNFLRPELPQDGLLDLLASPIELEQAQLERVRMGDAKRASGLVMAEELDDLEKSKLPV